MKIVGPLWRCRKSVIRISASLTVPTVPTLRCCIQTVLQSDSIFRVTICSTTAFVTGRATVPTVCTTDGTAKMNSSSAIRYTERTVLSIMPTGTAIRAATCQSACGTGWTASLKGSSSPAFLSSCLPYLPPSLRNTEQRFLVNSVNCYRQLWSPLLATRPAVRWLNGGE